MVGTIMNTTPANTGLTPVQWDSDFFSEYVRDNEFRPVMGTGINSIIQLKDDLTRKPGDTVVFAAVRRLVGAGVTGNTVLEGNEEVLDTHGLRVTVNPIRHGVAVTNWDEQKSAIALRDAAREALKNWAMEKMRADIIASLQSVNGVPFASATAAQRDAWLASNADRVLFGAAKGNSASGSTSTSLANVVPGTGKLSASVVSLAKRMAKMATPHIRPVKVSGQGEWFTMYANSLSFRDLKLDPVINAARRDALPRSENNPLFTDGDIVWDGVIVKEIPEFPILTGAGGNYTNAAGATVASDVGMNILCGAQAVGVAWAQRTKSATQDRDYDWQHGVAIQEIRGIQKMRFGRNVDDDTQNLVDHGMLTIFSSSPADA